MIATIIIVEQINLTQSSENYFSLQEKDMPKSGFELIQRGTVKVWLRDLCGCNLY